LQPRVILSKVAYVFDQELRELTKLEEEGYRTKFIVREDELELGTTPASKEELDHQAARPKVRIDKLLREAASKAFDGKSCVELLHVTVSCTVVSALTPACLLEQKKVVKKKSTSASYYPQNPSNLLKPIHRLWALSFVNELNWKVNLDSKWQLARASTKKFRLN
jgi:hypothetical protein